MAEEIHGLESQENEVVLSESVDEDERRIRVYDGDGDFIIDVPAGSKITFGYFNPASAGTSQTNTQWGREPNVMKTRLSVSTSAVRKGTSSPVSSA